MNPLESLRMLAGARRAEGSSIRRPSNVCMTQMEAVEDSSDGTVKVDPGGLVISQDGSQYIDAPTIGNVREGDVVNVALVGDDGSAKSMIVLGPVGGGDKQQQEINAAAAATMLEAPYTEVEWVESNGHQIVQLDWIPNLNGDFGFDADFVSYNTHNSTNPKWDATSAANRASAGFIFGARNGYTADQRKTAYNLGMYKGSAGGYMYLGQSGTQYDPGLYLDGRRQQCSYHGTTYTRPDRTTVEFAHGDGHPNWGMCVFCLPDNGTLSSYTFPSSTRLYSLKFYDGDTLAVDLVGAVRKSDGLTGLWDKVEGRFWPAAGMTFGDAVGDLGEKGTLSEQALANNPIVVDTKTEASRLWTGEAPTIHSLEDGQQITYRLRYPTDTEAQAEELANRADSGSSANVYLALTLADGTQTEWVPCYYGAGTRLTSHYAAGNDIRLVYHEDQVFGTTVVPRGWWADANYYNNTNNYDRRLHNDNVKAATAITAGHLICGDADGYHNVAAGVAFDLAYPVLYASAAIKANANAKTAYEAMPAINFSTSGTITGGAAAATIWLRGTVSGNTFTVANDDSPYLTCVTPTTRDGFCYIPLGLMTSATAGYFATSSQLYAFLGGYFGPRSVREVRRYITELDDGIMVHPEDDATTGWSIRAALELLKSGVSYIKAWLDNDVPKVRIGREDTGNLLIDDDSVDIRTGITKLATFAANLIELGKNGTSAVIEFCGGMARMRYDQLGMFLESLNAYTWLRLQEDGTTGMNYVTIGAHDGNSPGHMSFMQVEADSTASSVLIATEKVTADVTGVQGLLRPVGIYSVTMTTPPSDGADATVYFNTAVGDFMPDDTDYVVLLTPEGQPNGFTHVDYVVSAKYVNGFKIHSYNDWTSAITQTVVAVVMHK